MSVVIASPETVYFPVQCSDGGTCFNAGPGIDLAHCLLTLYEQLPRAEQIVTTRPIMQCEGLVRRGGEPVCSLSCRTLNTLLASDNDADRRRKIALIPAEWVMPGYLPTRHASVNADIDDPAVC